MFFRKNKQTVFFFHLFFPEVDSYRYPTEIEILPEFIFQIVPVRWFYIIWEIGEKGETGYYSRQLGDELDLDGMSPDHRGMICLNGFQHDLI